MPCFFPYYVDVYKPGRTESVPVPCGKCPYCKQRRVAEWSFRLRKQDEISACSFFVTLTYETPPLAPSGYMTLDSHLRGGRKPSELSKKRDLQLFFKSLRKSTPRTEWRYYAVGEYGSENWRPHYHLIIFSNVYYSKDEALIKLYKAWDKGNIDIGTVTGASVAYTLKYVCKPPRVPAHKNDDRMKEFSIMSKNLGLNFITPSIQTHYRNNLDTNYVLQDGFKIPMPRYYRDKILDYQLKSAQRDIIHFTDSDRTHEQLENFLKLHPTATIEDFYKLQLEARENALKVFHKNQTIRKL